MRQFFFTILACLYILHLQANNRQRATTPTLHINMNEDLRQELLEQINELLHFRGDSCDLYQQFDDLLLDYGFDGDPTELLYELM